MTRHTLCSCLLLTLILHAHPAAAEEAFDACLSELRTGAPARGVTPEAFSRHLETVTPDMSVLKLLDYQPEFRTPIWDYLAALVDDERVSDGKAMLAKWKDTLDAISESRSSPLTGSPSTTKTLTYPSGSASATARAIASSALV
jgi:membrane-bound lytic murein transglycosylase B